MTGLVDSPTSVIGYTSIAVLLAWPLLGKLVRYRRSKEDTQRLTV